MNYDFHRAQELLRLGTGQAKARFREGQEEAIRHIVEGRGRLLVVRKTGWGKSFVYFIATKLLREGGMGPALLVSPLLSLMRNQLQAAERMGVRAAAIHSENVDDWDSIEARVHDDEVDILLISPERLANPRFQQEVLARIANRVSLLVVDEAHCISDWGHDFRPNYRLLERIIQFLPPTLRLLGTTATANDRVMNDLQNVLGPNLQTSRGDLNRPSLTLQTIRLSSQAERLAWLAEQLPKLPGHGIIYTLTVRDANMVSKWLQERGLNVEAYSGETGDRREELENALLTNQLKALVATSALGMGYDKPDISFVIHYQTPGSVVAYYQQVGRAGRAVDSAYGVLLSGEEDSAVNDWFIRNAFPTREEVEKILEALEEEPEGQTTSSLYRRLNIREGRIMQALTLLSLESPAPIAKQGSKWQLTAANLSESFWERAARLTELRRAEQKQMQEYVSLPFGEHMPYLIRALDGDPSLASPPSLPPLSESVDLEIARQAVSFLRRTSLPIEARKIWPAGGLPRYQVAGRIPEELRAQEGRALCMWGDAGWGSLVRDGKYRDGRFSDELVEACKTLVGEWSPEPSPTWVTCVPSLRHPALVPDFARRLADSLGLPFHEALRNTEWRPEQKTMKNGLKQALNVDGSLELAISDLPPGPVFLVDDMVDSRWTLTIAAWLLLDAASGPVFPLALSFSGSEK